MLLVYLLIHSLSDIFNVYTIVWQLHACVGSALCAMGPETFLSLVPFQLEVQELSEANLWLFPILKQYTVGANLKFFSESILPMVTAMKRKSAMVLMSFSVIR